MVSHRVINIQRSLKGDVMQTQNTQLKLVAVVATLEISTKERLRRLQELDLTNVRRKLMEPYPEGKGWNQDQALEAEKWYKRYLASIIVYPDATQHVPNGPIDFFWHQHILDTMAYGQDCEHVMGYFLHHYPYFGLNGDTDDRDDAFVVTNTIYRQMYGEDCLSMKGFGFKQPSDGINLEPPIKEHHRVGAGCNHGGSGTGCGQGCGRNK